MFDHLTPEDFIRETSATREHREPTPGFDAFVDALLETCRAKANEDGDFPPFAVLHGADFQRYFEGEDDEVPTDFARRLQREAKQMNATHSFVAMVAPARAVYYGDDTPPVIDDTDLGAIQEALIAGHLDLCVCWTARTNEADEHLNRGGIMYLDDDGAIKNEVEGPLDPNTDPFNEVLA